MNFPRVPICTNNSRKDLYFSVHSFPIRLLMIYLLLMRMISAIFFLQDEGEHFKILCGSTYDCSQHFKESHYSKPAGHN